MRNLNQLALTLERALPGGVCLNHEMLALGIKTTIFRRAFLVAVSML